MKLNKQNPDDKKIPLKKAWGKTGKWISGISLAAGLHGAILLPEALHKDPVEETINAYEGKIKAALQDISSEDLEKAEADLEMVKELTKGRGGIIEDRKDEYEKFLEDEKNKNVMERNWGKLIYYKEYFDLGIETDILESGEQFYQENIKKLQSVKPPKLNINFLLKLMDIFTPSRAGDDVMASAFDSLALEIGPNSQNCVAKSHLLIMAITDLYPEMKEYLMMQFFGKHQRLIAEIDGQRLILENELSKFPDAVTAKRKNALVRVSDYFDYWLNKLSVEEYSKRTLVIGESAEKTLDVAITTETGGKSLAPSFELGDFETNFGEKIAGKDESKIDLEKTKEVRRENIKKLRDPKVGKGLEMEIIEDVLSLEKVKATWEDFEAQKRSGKISDVTDNFVFLEEKISLEAAKYMAETYGNIDTYAKMSKEIIDELTRHAGGYLKIRDNSISSELLTYLYDRLVINKRSSLWLGEPFEMTRERAGILGGLNLNIYETDLDVFKVFKNLDLPLLLQVTIFDKFDFDKLDNVLGAQMLMLQVSTASVDENFWEKLTKFNGDYLQIEYGKKMSKDNLEQLTKIKPSVYLNLEAGSFDRDGLELVANNFKRLSIMEYTSVSQANLMTLLKSKVSELTVWQNALWISAPEGLSKALAETTIERLSIWVELDAWLIKDMLLTLKNYQHDLRIITRLDVPVTPDLLDAINQLKATNFDIELNISGSSENEIIASLKELATKITRKKYTIRTSKGFFLEDGKVVDMSH